MKIAIHCKIGQKKDGVELAPYVFFKDYNYSFDITKIDDYQKLYDSILKLKMTTFPILFIGGDHTISISTISAMNQIFSPLHTIYIDAHGDINTRKSSISHNLNGMGLAFLLGLDKSPVKSPNLSIDQISYIGIRDLDPFEEDIIKKLNIE